MSINTQKLSATFGKPALAGAISGGYSYYQYAGETVPVFGNIMPTWAVIGLATAAATFVGEVAGNYILPKVLSSAPAQLASIATVAVNPTLCAASTVVSLKLVDPLEYSSKGTTTLALIGGGAYVASDYIMKNYFQNYL